MKEQTTVRDYGKELNGLFITPEGDRRVPDPFSFGNLVRDYLTDNHFELYSKWVEVDGVSLYYPGIGTSHEPTVRVYGNNVIHSFSYALKYWIDSNGFSRREMDGDASSLTVNKPLITTKMLENVLSELNDFDSLRSHYSDWGSSFISDEFILESDYCYYCPANEDCVYPEVDTSEAVSEWNSTDKSSLIELAGVITHFLNDNLPDWVVSCDSQKEAA